MRLLDREHYEFFENGWGQSPFHAVVYSFLHKDSLNTPYSYFVFKKFVMLPIGYFVTVYFFSNAGFARNPIKEKNAGP